MNTFAQKKTNHTQHILKDVMPLELRKPEIKNISSGDVIRLQSPCIHRGAKLVNNYDGSVCINDRMFGRMSDCEDYLISLERTDLTITDAMLIGVDFIAEKLDNLSN